MRLGILETGAPPAGLAHHGRFDAMVRDLLGEGFAHRTYDVQAGELPAIGSSTALLRMYRTDAEALAHLQRRLEDYVI